MIAMVNWVQIARVIYAETSALSARDFIAVERTLGAGTLRILGVHLIPHLAPTVLVWATLGISTTVLLEATLSFLGVGVQPPTPSWGNIIFESQSYFTSAPWLVFFPGAAIVLLSLSFNIAGDALRDALDPGLKDETNAISGKTSVACRADPAWRYVDLLFAAVYVARRSSAPNRRAQCHAGSSRKHPPSVGVGSSVLSAILALSAGAAAAIWDARLFSAAK